ncbi:MAG: hypothetical protein ACC660_05005, partial [Acidimicrobiales bacterium]
MTDTGGDDQPSGAMLWSSRVLRRSLFDADGSTVGTLHDIIVSQTTPGRPPMLRGFVAQVDRRKIFVHAARVDAIDRDGVHLRGGTVDLRQFKQRAGEIRVSVDIVGTETSQGPVTDVGLHIGPQLPRGTTGPVHLPYFRVAHIVLDVRRLLRQGILR